MTSSLKCQGRCWLRRCSCGLIRCWSICILQMAGMGCPKCQQEQYRLATWPRQAQRCSPFSQRWHGRLKYTRRQQQHVCRGFLDEISDFMNGGFTAARTLQGKWCMKETQLPLLEHASGSAHSNVHHLLLTPLLQLAESFADGMERRSGRPARSWQSFRAKHGPYHSRSLRTTCRAQPFWSQTQTAHWGRLWCCSSSLHGESCCLHAGGCALQD